MSLLIYNNPEESKNSGLLKYAVRHELATEVNDAILLELCQTYEKKLILLTKMMLYSQKKLVVPQIIDITTGKYN